MHKIAIYGGTFNPIHNGHVHLARQFAQFLGVDKVLLIPTRVPPHKKVSDLASPQDRLEMCRLASADSIFEACDIEIRRKGPSYTSETLKELQLRYPHCEFYLITGEDMFLTIQNWFEARTIYSLVTLCAAPRSFQGLQTLLEYAKILEQNGAKTIVKDIEYLPISSTMVRDAVRKGESISELVPPAVADYIMGNNLYLECVK
jgi:nicotinate-nucleotide adenylyltransferase